MVQQASRFVAGSSGGRSFKAGGKDRVARASSGSRYSTMYHVHRRLCSTEVTSKSFIDSFGLVFGLYSKVDLEVMCMHAYLQPTQYISRRPALSVWTFVHWRPRSQRPDVTAAWVARAAAGLERDITDEKLAQLLPFTVKFVLKQNPLTEVCSVELVPDRWRAASSLLCTKVCAALVVVPTHAAVSDSVFLA